MNQSPDIDLILGKLEGVQQHGSYWTSRCPSHDDHRSSLSVRVMQNGAITVKCFAGCEFKQIVSAMGLETKHFFPKDGKMNERAKSQYVEAYAYRDEDGKLLFQTCRYKPKDFRQRRTRQTDDPPGDGWIWSLEGVRRVLYRLPELLASKPRMVFVVEGEKDADALAKLGLVATTCPMGAGKWRKEYNEALEGRAVVVVPDLDGPDAKTGRRPGLAHAVEVCSALVGCAALVRLLDGYAEPDSGKDISDWLAGGGDRKQLEALVRACPKFQSPVTPEPQTEQPRPPGADPGSSGGEPASEHPEPESPPQGATGAITGVVVRFVLPGLGERRYHVPMEALKPLGEQEKR